MAVDTITISVPGTNATLHPYYPINAVIDGYIENSLPTPFIVTVFMAIWATVLSSAFVLVQRNAPNLPRRELAVLLWFTLCGFVHLFFEGYFAYNFYRTGSRTDLFGQLWKEYSLSDSRYMTQDSFIVCMETITAIFWGPLSFACAYCIATGHPLRHPLQSIISLGQLYGDVLYFATCHFDGIVAKLVYCRPEQVYFWAYYVFFNAIWIVIPFGLIVQSAVATSRAFARLKELEGAAGTKKRI